LDAVKWFCRAAKAGDKTAQHNLGLYYAGQEGKREASGEEAPPLELDSEVL
jgi:TPR repeat protein